MRFLWYEKFSFITIFILSKTTILRYKKILFLLIIIQELLNVDEFGPTPVKIQSKSIRLAGNDLKQST